jgi:hypothetical protein
MKHVRIINKESVIAGAFVALIILFGMLIFRYWNEGTLLGDITGSLDKAGEFVERDLHVLPPVAWASENSKFSVSDDLLEGISVTIADDDTTKDKRPLKLTFGKDYTEPLEVDLGDNRVIRVVDTGANKDYQSYLLSEEKITEDVQSSTSLWAKLFGSAEKKVTVDNQYLSYVSPDERKTILYSYGRDKGLGTRSLKQWTLYEKGTGQEKEEYRIENSFLRINADGGVDVFYFDEKAINDRPEVNGVDSALLSRVGKTFADEFQKAIEKGEAKPDFTIPKPYLVDREGAQIALDWKVGDENTIYWEVDFERARYPVAVDPTLSFVARSTTSGGAVITGETGAGHFGSVIVTGDFNADGRIDIASSSPNYSTNTGRVSIFYNDGNITNDAKFADVTITGGTTSDYFGIALAAGDFNADGKIDLGVGAEGYTTNTGRVYIYYNDGSIPTTAGTADVTLTGGATSDKFGHSLVSGDFNADGEIDIAIGASGKSSSAGGVYIYYNDGSYTTADVTITGTAASDAFGGALTSGDVNADSKTDLVVGATGYNPGGAATTGRAYIFHNDGSIPTTAATADVTITGAATTNVFGTALVTGDMNADSKVDIIISAPGHSTSTGRAYIFYNDGSVPTTAGTADVTITGETTSNSFGAALVTGDMNADGKPDLIVGATGYTTSTGRAYMFYSDGSIPTTAATADVIVTGESTSDQLGYALATGDLNTDGKLDLSVGSYGFSGADGNGRVHIFYSQNGQININKTMTGSGTNNYFGSSFAKGDFNSDGRIDLAVGAEGVSSDAGAVYLFYNDGTLPTAAGSADLTITGTALSDFFGVAMTAGDFNADGRTDIAVGARGYNPGAAADTGRAYIFYNDGSTPTAAGSADVTITGGAIGDYFGISLATGDMNTDNKDDLIVGAERYSSSLGRAYAFLNDGSIPTTAGTADVTFTGVSTPSRFGGALAVGDYDNSGTDDLFIGAYGRNTNTGRVYLFRNTTATIDNTSDDTITGAGTNDFLGASMTTGDFDDDGDTDIAFSSYGYNAGGNEGRVYMFYNDETGVFPSLANANVVIDGDTDSRFGAALSSGDVNADGRTDLIVGGWGYSTSTGRAYIFYNDGAYPSTAATADVVFTGDATSDIFGNTLITYDTTGDGKEDLIVGAEGHSTNTGRIYLYETKINFSWKNQTQVNHAIRSNGDLSGEEQIMTGEWGASNTFGSTLAVGDLNADGRLDVAVGAPTYSSNTGKVYIFYSDTRLTPNASGAEVSIIGGATSDLFGSALVTGDFNTDGKGDLAIGAPGHSSSTGRAYIYYGDGKIPTTAATADITITGNATGDLFGTALAAGDVNNSADTDLLVGAPDYLTTQGRVYVFYNDGAIPTTAATADVTITGNASNDAFGAALTSKDFSTDGRMDIAVGAYGYNPGSAANTGRAYIFNGDGTIPTTAATADTTITGNATSDNFGATLTSGDLNKDGKGDLVVGAYGYSTSTGRAYLFYGDGSIPTTAAAADVTITGNATSDEFGRTLAVGDINTDSFPDLAIGARSYSTSTGRVYIYNNDGSYPTTAATADATMTGETTSTKYGSAIAIGDFDSDGKTDMFIGANNYTVNTFTVGRVYLYTFNDNVITGGASGDCFGRSLTSGDLNSDGKIDLVVSADCYSGAAGRVYIYYADGILGTTAATADVTITGAAGDDHFGTQVATGDFNYDSKTDIIVSASAYLSGNNKGRAYIFYNDGTMPTTAGTADVTITGTADGDLFGSALAVGDFNSDNRTDFAIGATGVSSGAGSVYIFHNDGTIPTTAGGADVTISGTTAGDDFGTSLAAGDFNSDSRVDLAIGGPDANSLTGRVYIFHNDGSIPTTAAAADVTITGDTSTNLGTSLVAGDFNADGRMDIASGAPEYLTDTGALYAFYNDGSIPTTTATADVTIAGTVSGAYFATVIFAGDINTDGKIDLLAKDALSVYVYYNDGSYPSVDTSGEKVFTDTATGYGSAGTVMDINLDGKQDVILGSPSDGNGKVYSFVSETEYVAPFPTSAKIRGRSIFRGDVTVR